MDINELATKDFMDYSMEVIKNRAIPGIDGNKPIHRRILYIMKDIGNTSNKPTRKCAKVTGEIMGRAHPHGSSSIYDALVRLSQSWKMRYPLIEMQGNNGNIQGDKPAAERYTECRLSPIGELMCKDIDKDCVPTELNYSDEELLPTLLTSEFPNILCNPSLGIAVSMSSTTLPHNIVEVCDALICLIRQNYNFTVEDLFKYVKGPDFPTGAIIINGDELKNIYNEGKGSIKIRSKYRVETVNNKINIIIEEIPYLINPMEKIYEKIKNMVIEEGFTEIENIQNNIGNNGFELRIICSKNANINKIIKVLCEKTGFQSSISMNNTILINGQPRKMTYIDMMKEYINFRHNIIINIAKYNKNKADERIHIINGLLVAIADIDNVIQLIKESNSKDEARKKLIAKYNFSLEQTNAILDMKLSKLTNLEKVDLQSELGELLEYSKKQQNIIDNKGTREKLIIEQLNNIKNKFGDKRRTQIISIKEQKEDVKEEKIINLILQNNNILPLPIAEKIQLNKKGSPFSKESINIGCITTNLSKNYVFDSKGKMYIIDNSNLDINTINPYIFESKPISILKELDKEFLITISKNGVIKKTDINKYKEIKKSSIAVKIREDDELIYAGCGDNNDFILVLGEKGGLVKVQLSSIKDTGVNTIGSKIIDDKVSSATIAGEDDLIFTFSDGKSKFTKNADFNLTSKGGKGQVITENTNLISRIKEDFYIVEKNNKITLYNNNSLSIKGKTAIGAKISSESEIKIII